MLFGTSVFGPFEMSSDFVTSFSLRYAFEISIGSSRLLLGFILRGFFVLTFSFPSVGYRAVEIKVPSVDHRELSRFPSFKLEEG